MKKIQPATKYDVVNVARAMNDDFAPQLKELFTPEQEACMEAIKTGKIKRSNLFGMFLNFISHSTFNVLHSYRPLRLNWQQL